MIMSQLIVQSRVSIRDFRYEDIVSNVHPLYKNHIAQINEAIDHHYGLNLSYNCDDGITRNREGKQAEYVSKQDVPKYTSMNDVLLYQLMPFINNSVSRLLRGYSA